MTEIVCVGTSDAFGAGGRLQSAYLVRSEGGTVLMDCGQTTGTGLAALGILRDEIDAIVVSHFHADHFGGIPLLLLGAQYEDARRRPICITGPAGIEARVHEAARALGHPLDVHRWGFSISYRELAAGSVVEAGPVRARAFATLHSPDSQPHGLVLETGSHRIAYSGDTGWFPELASHVRGSDFFLCECTQARRGYEYHLSLDELVERRAEFDCGRFLLTHLGEEMRALGDYNGFDVADDRLVIKL